MKEYFSIPGPSKAPNLPCIAFYKYDGSNIRAEWSKKRGWYKFGTRHQMLSETCPLFGGAISLFLNTLSDNIIKVINDNKDYSGVDNITVFCEYFGDSSIGMYHDWDELKSKGKMVLFDISIYKRGFVLPRNFVKHFGHLDNVAQVVYEGNFNKQFVQDVWEGKYPVKEGVVAKGVQPCKGKEEHGLWLVKCKTKWWFDALDEKYKSIDNEEYKQKWKKLLEENKQEQLI